MVSSVHYPIAKDGNGKWVKVAEAQRGGSYFCPECETPFVLRLGSVRIHHFAHKPGYHGECSGESGYHNLAKHLLAYYFEEKGYLTLSSKCPTCSREFSEGKRIIDVQVEKGNDDYRPDVRLLLEKDIIVECEVVYKNPLADKLNAYRERKGSLLVWEIDKEVNEVPNTTQRFWEDVREWRYEHEKHYFKNKLLLLASPSTPTHICSPYGVAYVFEVDCWKCHKITKVAFLSTWYPMWGDLSNIGETSGPIDYHTNISFNMVPAEFWRNLNERYGTNLREDYSKTASMKYLMNHCSKCNVKIGDFPLGDQLLDIFTANQGSNVTKVTIDFKLTAWEKDALVKRPLKHRPD